MSAVGLFVTGTDTGVGKTHLTCLLARQLRDAGVVVGAYKPAASGREAGHWHDVDALAQATGHTFPLERICPQRFIAPLAPPEAARAEGRTVDGQLLKTGVDWWRDRVDVLLVEGVGGLLCPLTDSETVVDLAAALDWPVLIVARNGLGTINHTLLTVEVARGRGLNIAGVVINEPECPDESSGTNATTISHHGNIPILAHVTHGDSGHLRPVPGSNTIDWLSVVGFRANPLPLPEDNSVR